VIARLDTGEHTVLHGDPHPGNCYFVDGRAGLLDWQVLRRGDPLRDVAYHVVIGLDPDTRRTSERDLLDHYRAALAGHGGPELSADEAWAGYRRMAAAPYVAAAFTVGLTGLQRDDIAKAGLRRAAAAIVDLGTADALGIGPGGPG
jgi:aminoglycoside phosphotransferase (APT) family kinase protein